MEDRRVTPLAGVLSVVLFVVALFVIESEATPDVDASATEAATYLDGALGTLAVALIIWGVGSILLLWFFEGLRAWIAGYSEQLGRLTFFFGFAVILLMLASFLPDLAGAFASDELDGQLEPAAAQALTSLGDGFFFGAEVMLVGLFLAAGLAALQARAFPAWVGWLSFVLAVIALIPPIGWAVVIWGFPLWIFIMSAIMWRRGPREVPAAS